MTKIMDKNHTLIKYLISMLKELIDDYDNIMINNNNNMFNDNIYFNILKIATSNIDMNILYV